MFAHHHTDVALTKRAKAFSALVLCLVLFTCTATDVAGQSVTGRTQIPDLPGRETGRLIFSAGAGMLTSGDLFKVTTLDGEARFFSLPAGGQLFNSAEFIVTLDEDALVNAAVAYQLTPVWRARLDISWSEVDATAEARIGQTVELLLYDRLTMIMGGLTIERGLLAQRSYPYLLAGLGLVDLSADNAGELDQSVLGLRIGAGFHHAFDERWGVRFEIRDTIQQFQSEEHASRLPNVEGLEIEERGPQNLFEIMLNVQGYF